MQIHTKTSYHQFGTDDKHWHFARLYNASRRANSFGNSASSDRKLEMTAGLDITWNSVESEDPPSGLAYVRISASR